MGRPRRFRASGASNACLLAALALAPLAVRADTVASLLGNFTINQYCGLQLTSESVNVRYAVVFGQLPALRELHVADTNGDGVTTQAERDAYAGHLAPALAQGLRLIIDGSPAPLRTQGWSSSLPSEQGGFSLRLDVQYSAALPRGERATHTLSFVNGNYADQFGWNEITVQSASAAVFDTDAFSTSLTSALTAAVQTLPPTGPLTERSIHLKFTQGSVPAGARLIQARGGTPQQMNNTAASGNGEQAWLQRQTRSLVDLISAPHVAPHVTILALLIALVLGAAHALSPGHGKTIVGAYLIGSRGTPRHAVFLGITVTLTHTLGVFVLGFATLAASRFFVPERLFPILSLASGLLVLGMGIVLLTQRWRAAQQHAHRSSHAAAHDSDRHSHTHSHVEHAHHHHVHTAVHTHHSHEHHDHHDHSHDDHGHSHDEGEHDHDHGHHNHEVLLTHSHGGGAHSHLAPVADAGQISWRSLLALGISGGLVPCPSAMVLLLAAVALNKTAYGLLLVVAFSVGLAATLTLVGLMFLYARSRFGKRHGSSRWVRILPVASAATITVIGAVLCVAAVQTLSVLH
jgi:ABC-type nickel/cobalt efflux system permease component RcnA